MIISHKYKFIFINTFNTAGTSLELYYSKFASIKDVLSPVFPDEPNHTPRNYLGLIHPFRESKKYNFSLKSRLKEFLLLRRFYSHMPAYLIKERIPRNIWNSYMKFCIERNPWDKSVSHFHMMKYVNQQEMVFNYYLYNSQLCHNYPLYADPFTQEVLVDLVIAYDRLNEELYALFSELGVPISNSLEIFSDPNLRTNGKPYQDYYSERTKEFIREKFKDEIDFMGFEF